MIAEKITPEDLEKILDSEVGERPVAAYLKINPWIPYWTICSAAGHCRYALPEFPLGSRWKVDLLLLNSYSGTWEAHFIEFEPAGDPVFTKKRTPTKAFAAALRQIDDWKSYWEENRGQVRADMVSWAKTKDKLLYSTRAEPSNNSGDYLANPETVIFEKYYIVIGRSSKMNVETRQLAGKYQRDHGVQVFSYDRFLELAKRRYPMGKHFADDPG